MRYLVETHRRVETTAQYVVEAANRTAAKAIIRAMTPDERERAMVADDVGSFRVVSETVVRALEDAD